MGIKPNNLSIDRIDNNLGYFKKNCRWATREVQSTNRRNNKNLTYKGKTQCVSHWAKEIGISQALLWHRLYAKKMSLDLIIKNIKCCTNTKKI